MVLKSEIASLLNIWPQGGSPVATSGPWCLTFALGSLGTLRFFIPVLTKCTALGSVANNQSNLVKIVGVATRSQEKKTITVCRTAQCECLIHLLLPGTPKI